MSTPAELKFMRQRYEWPEPCPSCGNPMEVVKRKRSPKSPDYMCSNRDCDPGDGYRFSAWAKSEEKPSRPQPASRPSSQPTAIGTLMPKATHTWADLRGVAEYALKIAKEHFSEERAQAAFAATLMIQADKWHLPNLVTPPTREELNKRPAALDDGEEWEEV